MAYPLVNIINSTTYKVEGEVCYLSGLCRNDDYSIQGIPGSKWEAKSRGVCLVTEVSATVNIGDKKIVATPYKSSGTSYSQFAVIHDAGNNKFLVTRRVTGTKDVMPEDYQEPTETQK